MIGQTFECMRAKLETAAPPTAADRRLTTGPRHRDRARPGAGVDHAAHSAASRTHAATDVRARRLPA